jgi:hypothetical protein
MFNGATSFNKSLRMWSLNDGVNREDMFKDAINMPDFFYPGYFEEEET